MLHCSLRCAGATYKYDLSLPTADLYRLVEVMRQQLSHHADVEVVGYGHLGDGNLHLNISTPAWSDELARDIEPFVYVWTAEHGGSISAEHGLGRMKKDCIKCVQRCEQTDSSCAGLDQMHSWRPSALGHAYACIYTNAACPQAPPTQIPGEAIGRGGEGGGERERERERPSAKQLCWSAVFNHIAGELSMVAGCQAHLAAITGSPSQGRPLLDLWLI